MRAKKAGNEGENVEFLSLLKEEWKRSGVMQLLLIFALVFALGVALFAVQNATPVEISFLIYRFQEISLVVVILISVLTGAIIVFLLSAFKQVSYLRKIHALEKQKEALEKQNETLRQELKQRSLQEAVKEQDREPVQDEKLPGS